MNILYTTTANATGDGRNGHAELEDGSVSFDMRIPTQMGGAGGGANPEQLFALGYAACFHSALKVVAGTDKSDVSDSEVSATVGIGQTSDGVSDSRLPSTSSSAFCSCVRQVSRRFAADVPPLAHPPGPQRFQVPQKVW